MKINDIESYNAGIYQAMRVLRAQFFAGQLDGANDTIVLLEAQIIPLPENGIFSTEIPDSVMEEYVPPVDLLEVA